MEDVTPPDDGDVGLYMTEEIANSPHVNDEEVPEVVPEEEVEPIDINTHEENVEIVIEESPEPDNGDEGVLITETDANAPHIYEDEEEEGNLCEPGDPGCVCIFGICQ